jgi:hypothetical protein
MTSEELYGLADALAGRAARGERLEPPVIAHLADVLRAAAEMTANMEACVVAPEVALELTEMIDHAA